MIRIALAQVNTTTGDLEGNSRLVHRAIKQAKEHGADLVAFPEMVITGYPPDDLLLNKGFLADSARALEEVARSARGISAIVGCVEAGARGALYNAAAVISEGRVRAIYRKHELPNYGVFDERRFFEPGSEILVAKIGSHIFGVTICEDLWIDDGPHAASAAAGASMIVNINASPYHAGKSRERWELLSRRATENNLSFAYVNSVGGNDELIFDGQSMALSQTGELIARAATFQEELLVFDVDPLSRPYQGASRTTLVDLGPGFEGRSPPPAAQISEELDAEHEVYSALVLGVRDYMGKNGFRQALVGVSGGIDSALTLVIASDAIGADNVLAISNPSDYTSTRSIRDAEALCENLGVELGIVPIGDALDGMRKALDPIFTVAEGAVTDQNLQARIRGTLWMAISNETGRLVLSTGNKSELAVGYATLYGDMAGGFAVLKDVPKTLVWKLARWRNRRGEVIPQSIINRAPSAELAPNQLDTDILPPYDVLDSILKAYIEDRLSVDEIVGRGYDRELVLKIVAMVNRAEYKRRQAPPGIKISKRAFGRDRRLPITNKYRPN
jgi:NAD+ synthase (glutamine-hydrolysing)